MGIDLLGAAAGDKEKAQKADRLGDPLLQPLAWTFLELPTTRAFAMKEPYWWKNILKWSIPSDPSRVSRLAADALVSRGGGLSAREAAMDLLVEVARTDTQAVLSELKRVMLSESTGWHFHIGNYKELFAKLDQDSLIGWIESEGLNVAQHCARHLPLPYLDADGKPRVPKLTEAVLDRFSDDKSFFGEFLAGTQNHGVVFVGSLTGKTEEDAELARKFLLHRSAAVRRWAIAAIDSAQSTADSLRDFEEELDL